jgi:hypothetical protein
LWLGGVLLLVVADRGARRSRPRDQHDRRWLRLASFVGLAEVVHSAVLGGLGIALARGETVFPLPLLAWAEDWVFIVADGLLIGLLPLALPVTRRNAAWSRVVDAGILVAGVGAAANMVTPRDLDNPAGYPNPLGIPALHALVPVGIAAFFVVSFVGLALALVRFTAGSFARDRAGRPAARAALLATTVLLAVFLGSAVAGEDATLVASLLSAASITLACWSTAVLGVRALDRRPRRSDVAAVLPTHLEEGVRHLAE